MKDWQAVLLANTPEGTIWLEPEDIPEELANEIMDNNEDKSN